jgi:hypothetical protein
VTTKVRPTETCCGVDLLADLERCRGLDARRDDRAVLASYLAVNATGELIEGEAVADRCAEQLTHARHSPGGADVGMAGEWDLVGRREDAHLGDAVAAVGRGQDEGRLRIMELCGDALHRLAIEPARVRDDRDLIAAERLGREDIERQVIELAHALSSRSGFSI